MEKSLWKTHPFRLLLYLEWILLGIALLAAFSSPRFPAHLRPMPVPRGGIRLPLGVFASIVALGIMGLKLPVGSRLERSLYVSLGFGLSWLAVLFGGRVESVFPALLLIVVIRACIMFSWGERLIVAAIAYGSFLCLLLFSLLRFRPWGIPLPRPSLPPGVRRLPPELFQAVLIRLAINSALLFALVLIFVLLLVSALVAEKQSRQELVATHQRLRRYALLIEDQATLQERNRIAREIHDSVGHFLTAQSIQLENVAMLLSEDPAQAERYLQKARQLGKEALQSVRQSVATLRSHPLQGQSLQGALSKLIQEFEQTTQTKLESQIDLNITLSTEIATALYRVVQEALTNISKHSRATVVRLVLKEEPMRIYLELRDNGIGFDPAENTTGFGLQGMRERIEAVGGDFSLKSQFGEGCCIQIDLPIARRV